MFPGVGGQIAHLPTSLENHCSKNGKSRHYLTHHLLKVLKQINFFVTENVTVTLSPRFLVPGMNNWDWMRWYSAHRGRESRRAVLAMLLRCDPSTAGLGLSLGRQCWRWMSAVRWRCRDWKMVQWFRWVGGEKRMHESSVSTLLFCHKCSPWTERCLDVCSERVKIWSVTGIYVWMNPVHRQRKKSPPFIPPY